MLTKDQLLEIVPEAADVIDEVYPALVAAMDEFEIDTPRRQAMFIPTVAHESQAFHRTSENFNYRPDALRATFNTMRTERFSAKVAGELGRTSAHAANQEAIANIAYANRMGNGDVASGDGWRNRGSGWIQTTGAKNSRAVADHFGIPYGEVGDWMRSTEGAARSAAYFWQKNGCNQVADEGDFVGVCAIVNVGHRDASVTEIKGLAEREKYYDRARASLGLSDWPV